MYYLRKRIGRAAKRALGLQTFPPGRYRHLYAEIESIRARRILEIGTNDGSNAVEMASVVRRNGGEMEYFGFDLFEALDHAGLIREFAIPVPSFRDVASHLRRHGVAHAQLVAGDTRTTLPKAVPTLGHMDLIFIDGGHSYETVLSDWHSVQPIASEKTSIFFDDYPGFGVGRVVDGIDRESWEVTILPTIDRFPVKGRSSASGSPQSTLDLQLVRARRRKAAD